MVCVGGVVGFVVFVQGLICVGVVMDFVDWWCLCHGWFVFVVTGFCAVGLTSRFEVYKLDILTSRRRSQAWVIKQFFGIFLLQ